MSKIIWKEPPPAATAGHREMQEIISELKAHAGQWGVVAHRKASTRHPLHRQGGMTMSRNQIWPGEHIGCDCGCETIGDGPDEDDGTPQYGGVTDDYNSITYPWNQAEERDYWTEAKDRKAEARP